MSKALTDNDLADLYDWFRGVVSEGQSLYAVLDAARQPAVPSELRKAQMQFVSLYRGEPEEALAHVAPYLVKADQNAEFLRWLLRRGWGESWGVFLASAATMEKVRQHLRRFLLVRDPDGRELYFRYYDPRVLRVYLPTCTAPELKRFLGPIDFYIVESEDGQAVLEYSLGGMRTLALENIDKG